VETRVPGVFYLHLPLFKRLPYSTASTVTVAPPHLFLLPAWRFTALMRHAPPSLECRGCEDVGTCADLRKHHGAVGCSHLDFEVLCDSVVCRFTQLLGTGSTGVLMTLDASTRLPVVKRLPVVLKLGGGVYVSLCMQYSPYRVCDMQAWIVPHGRT
jgi:hypothetical protein